MTSLIKSFYITSAFTILTCCSQVLSKQNLIWIQRMVEQENFTVVEGTYTFGGKI